MTAEREHLLDEIARCFARAAVDSLLDDPTLFQENADVSGQDQRRRKGSTGVEDTAIPPAEAT